MPATPLMVALGMAADRLKCSDYTKVQVKSALKYILKSARALNIDTIPVEYIRRKHASLILNNCGNVKKIWTAQLFNHYRAYLMMCFKKLVELEAIEFNPVDDHLPKEHVEARVRKTLNNEQVKRILEHFSGNKYYLRFIHIFFHSGARPVELLRIKTEDVNLKEGVFTIKVRKGNKYREQEKPIKKVAMKYWEEIMSESSPGQYIFGYKLKPGDKPATRDYLTKKWQREVKVKLKIDVDLYSLKHKNLDEIAAYLSIKEAQKAAGHESQVITMVYAVGEKKRENERYANVPNALGE